MFCYFVLNLCLSQIPSKNEIVSRLSVLVSDHALEWCLKSDHEALFADSRRLFFDLKVGAALSSFSLLFFFLHNRDAYRTRDASNNDIGDPNLKKYIGCKEKELTQPLFSLSLLLSLSLSLSLLPFYLPFFFSCFPCPFSFLFFFSKKNKLFFVCFLDFLLGLS